MRHYDFSPLYRSTVGFDRFASLLDQVTSTDAGANSYPPYNIEFERRFQLADHVKAVGAVTENGLLHVDLVREVPEALKPRTIEIAKPVKVTKQKAKAVTKAA